MIVNKQGAEFLYQGNVYRIGDRVVAAEGSEYAGLNGVIFEIRDGEEKETENDTPDIYCSFEKPVLPSDIEELERRFSILYQQKKHLEDIALDVIIMMPEMLMIEESAQRKTDMLSVVLGEIVYGREDGKNQSSN